MIEARIGELLPTADEAQSGGKLKGIPKKEWPTRGDLKVLPHGISPNQAHRARAIASHPREVAEVIKETKYVRGHTIPKIIAIDHMEGQRQENTPVQKAQR